VIVVVMPIFAFGSGRPSLLTNFLVKPMHKLRAFMKHMVVLTNKGMTNLKQMSCKKTVSYVKFNKNQVFDIIKM
jgi:hypothetical protein